MTGRTRLLMANALEATHRLHAAEDEVVRTKAALFDALRRRSPTIEATLERLRALSVRLRTV